MTVTVTVTVTANAAATAIAIAIAIAIATAAAMLLLRTATVAVAQLPESNRSSPFGAPTVGLVGDLGEGREGECCPARACMHMHAIGSS